MLASSVKKASAKNSASGADLVLADGYEPSEDEDGYCQVTGEPISLDRLKARPIATMTVEAQEAHERNEKISRDQWYKLLFKP